jgi:sulfur carrier protein
MKINGKEISLPDGTSVLEYLQQQAYQLERIAVEYNGDILQQAQYGTTILQTGDCVEIVSFVGGG